MLYRVVQAVGVYFLPAWGGYAWALGFLCLAPLLSTAQWAELLGAAPKLSGGLTSFSSRGPGLSALIAGALCYQIGWLQKTGDSQAGHGVSNIVCHHAPPHYQLVGDFHFLA